MNKNSSVVIGVALTVVAIFSCNTSSAPKADDTGWTKQGIQEVVNANNKFALDLYSELIKSETGNIFFSPYSISAALAITYEGAKGKTADEIKDVFHFPESNILRPNFAKIYNDINEAAKDYELRTANALWIQKDFPLLKEYINRIKKYYAGKATNLDFVKETEKARQTINRFIEQQTKAKIKDLIPQGVLDRLTRLVITNAIYFKGFWEREFDKKYTKEMDFYITPTETVKVPMMYMEDARFNYADLEKLQILELPYKGKKISMLILLPKENLDDIKPLTAEKIKEWKKQMQEAVLDEIYIPKFELKTKYTLNENLKALGMPTAFDPEKADFSGMTKERDLFISDVIHQAYVKVDEKGTEAAAATAVVMKVTAVMPKKIFRADKPFIFIIQEKETGNILFLGRIIDPTK